MGLFRTQEPIWLNAWLDGVFNYETGKSGKRDTLKDRLCIEDTMLQSIKPYDVRPIDERYVGVARTYNEAHRAFTNSHYKICLTRVQEIKKSYLTTRRGEQRNFSAHYSEMLWEATVFWKANLMEMMIAPLSHVSVIIQRVFGFLPSRMTFYDVMVNAHGGIVPEVFREFVQLCYSFDTRPKWFFETRNKNTGNMEEDGFLPVNEELQGIRRSICR